MKKRGKFIVIEGLDGSGATTQVQMLVKVLRRNGKISYETKEPTDNVIGGLIRGALTGVYKLPDTTLQFLFSADRGHHLDRFIEPALENGYWIICDRYIWSTISFGSIKLDRAWLLETQKYFRRPDLSLILKVNPKTCIKRIRADRYDLELFEEEKKLRKVWNTYAWLARKEPENICVIDANQNARKVHEDIWRIVEKKFF